MPTEDISMRDIEDQVNMLGYINEAKFNEQYANLFSRMLELGVERRKMGDWFQDPPLNAECKHH